MDDGALGKVLVVATDLCSLITIDSSMESVAEERDCASNLGRIKVSIGESTFGDDVEVCSALVQLYTPVL